MRFFWMLAACLAAAAAPAVAVPADDPLPVVAPAAEGFSPERLEKLDRFMREATDQKGYLGGVTLIARNGHIVDWQAYGHRDLARKAPMARDAIFRIYSMTKTVATVAVMMLVEEGSIALDDPVSKYLPGFSAPEVITAGADGKPVSRPAMRPITIHHLLTHTAGFPAGLKGDEPAMERMEQADPHGALDLRGFVERLSRAPLAADPGTRFGYDAAALEVAARLVEVVGGASFEQFLRDRIFVPLGMRDTGFSVPAAEHERVVDISTMGADGKLRLDGGPSALHPGAPLNAYTSGAGGLYSTAGDYARFCQMLLNRGQLDDVSILGRKTVESMMRNHLTMLDRPVTQFSDAEGFGLGGYVVIDVALRGQLGSLGQFGWSGSASTTFTIDPEEKLIAILMLQHLPRQDLRDLPRISRNFYTLVYQGLVP